MFADYQPLQKLLGNALTQNLESMVNWMAEPNTSHWFKTISSLRKEMKWTNNLCQHPETQILTQFNEHSVFKQRKMFCHFSRTLESLTFKNNCKNDNAASICLNQNLVKASITT